MDVLYKTWIKNRALAAAMMLAVSASGCVSLISNLQHAIHGPPKVPAAFDKFPKKRVAVICMSQADLYGTGGVARSIARSVEQILSREVEEIDLVGQDALEDWMDHNDWNQLNFTQIGRGMKADYVLAIELNSPITLKEGPTLFKGRADITVTVYDIAKNGEVVLRKQSPELSWPTNGRYGLSESAFERLFLGKIAEHIAKQFHPYEPNAELGMDTMQD
jgi:hypothetical protein